MKKTLRPREHYTKFTVQKLTSLSSLYLLTSKSYEGYLSPWNRLASYSIHW